MYKCSYIIMLYMFLKLIFLRNALKQILIKNKWTINKGNAKRGVSPRLKIRPCDLDLWPWKSIGFQILLRSKYVPSLVKIHWRMFHALHCPCLLFICFWWEFVLMHSLRKSVLETCITLLCNYICTCITVFDIKKIELV
jgi:hypothetical protein